MRAFLGWIGCFVLIAMYASGGTSSGPTQYQSNEIVYPSSIDIKPVPGELVYGELAEPAPEVQEIHSEETKPTESVDYYTNSFGESVQSPTHYDNGAPDGATAECRDGSYSFSQSRRGTCSGHGGVSEWL